MNYAALGDKQKAALGALMRHTVWFPGCGWIWVNRSTTVRILDSLVKRGFACKESRPNTHALYRPSKPYLDLLGKIKPIKGE